MTTSKMVVDLRTSVAQSWHWCASQFRVLVLIHFSSLCRRSLPSCPLCWQDNISATTPKMLEVFMENYPVLTWWIETRWRNINVPIENGILRYTFLRPALPLQQTLCDLFVNTSTVTGKAPWHWHVSYVFRLLFTCNVWCLFQLGNLQNL